MRLRHRTLNAGAWTVGGYGIELASRLISSLILTRLLFPEAFGLIAAASSLIVALTLLSDIGIRAVIIQSDRGDHVDFLRSAWLLQIGRGIAIWVILVIACLIIQAPTIHELIPHGTVFEDPAFPAITISMGFGLVLNGLLSTSLGLNHRRLNYRPIALIDMTAGLSAIVISIVLAYLTASVWALVAGSLFRESVRLFLSHISLPGPRMALEWNSDHFREIIKFGRWINISSIASFLSSQSDVVVLGFLLPSSSLGLYILAKSLADAAEGLFQRTNAILALPVLGETYRNNASNLRDVYYRFRLPIDIAATLTSGFIFVTGVKIVELLYDPRYIGAGPMLQLLSLGLIFFPSQIIGVAFTAIGRTRTNAIVSVAQASASLLFLLVGFSVFGLLGAIAGIATSRMVPSIIYLALAYQENWLSVWRELRIIPIFAIGYFVGLIAISILQPLLIAMITK